MLIDHDVAPGPLNRCQICGSENLHEIIDLGHQPPCDALLTEKMLHQPEQTYPLALNLCGECGLAQLSYVVAGEEIYPPEYPYRSGISKPLEEYQRAFADNVIARGFSMVPSPLVVDIGSNDGTLLTGFKARGWRALGVEPTDVAQIAEEENRIHTVQAFFTEEVAKDIVVEYGRAAVVTMTNVFAHMATLGTVMRGLGILLARDGVFISESHYLLDVMRHMQFDTIYHEHIRTYSLRSLCRLFEQYGMEVFDVERGSRYGGNIRVYVAKKGTRHISRSVADLLVQEGILSEPWAWSLFRTAVLEARDDMMEFLHYQRRTGNSVVGCSAPGRASTLINFYGIDPTLVPYTGELHNSLKLDKYLPGSHIPVVSNVHIIEDNPDFVILFAWHYREAIEKRLRSEGVRGKLVVPLPHFYLLED